MSKITVRRFSLYKILFISMITDPIFIIYAQDVGLGIEQIFMLLSVQKIVALLFEIPTGMLADVQGPKYSLIYGVGSFALANVIYIIFSNQAGFIVASVLIGLYKNFISGAETSYLYLALKESKQVEEFSRINGFLNSLNLIITAVVTVGVGYIYHLNRILPFILAVLSSVTGLIILLNLKNLMEENNQIKDVRRQYQKYLMTIKEGFSEIGSKKSLKWFISYSSIMSFMLVGLLSTYQIYFKDIGIDVKYFGWLYAVFYLTSSLFSKYAYLFSKKNNQYLICLAMLIILGFIPLSMATGLKMLLVVVLIPRAIIGVYPTIIHQFINKEINKNRATILSFRSFSMQVPQILLLPLVGKLLGSSLDLVYYIYFALMISSSIALYGYYKMNNLKECSIIKNESVLL